MFDEKLLAILVCPKSHGQLIYHKNTNELWCLQSQLAYPVDDGIPVLLIDSARQLTTEELQSR